MRYLLKITAATVVLAPVGTLWAQPVLTAPSADLNIVASEIVRSVPDIIIFTVPVSSRADTVSAARSQNKIDVERIRTLLIREGIDTRSIVATVPNVRFGFVGNEFQPGMTPEARAELLKKKSVQTDIQISISGLTKSSAIRDLLEQENLTINSLPIYQLKDDSSARRSAIERAIAKARSDAETYAAALGFRILSISKITNQGAITSLVDDYATSFRGVANPLQGNAEVVTTARVSIDFKIAPR